MKLELEENVAYYCATKEIANKFAEAIYFRYPNSNEFSDFPLFCWSESDPFYYLNCFGIDCEGNKTVISRMFYSISKDIVEQFKTKVVDVEELLKTIDEPQGKPTKPLGTAEQDKPKNEPIMQFESQEQLNASLKEWQDRLGLMDWIIKAKIISWHDFESPHAEDFAAEILQVNQSKSAEIHIRPKEEIVVATVKKQPQEKGLIHELLHIRHFPERATWDNIQSVAWEETQHQNLDEIATAFIMAKYNITLDWFRVED